MPMQPWKHPRAALALDAHYAQKCAMGTVHAMYTRILRLGFGLPAGNVYGNMRSGQCLSSMGSALLPYAAPPTCLQTQKADMSLQAHGVVPYLTCGVPLSTVVARTLPAACLRSVAA